MSVWTPLEADCESLNTYITNLGCENLQLVDLYGFEQMFYDMVPQPVHALILLYPLNDSIVEFEKKSNFVEKPEKITYLKQYIGNACGTIALLHSILNTQTAQILPDSILDKIQKFNGTPEEIGNFLMDFEKLESVHQESAAEQLTEVPSDVDLHFIAFVEKDGQLYELDGRKEGVVSRGPILESFLSSCGNVCNEYIYNASGDFRFNAMALVDV
eukprot:TRINITY_DN1443_c0_g1_i1.p1 TRINITY_DN1443_c0_g1~~TRINITY_DN1443_c0_g1_i1.p1  ORF type:complete len:215 (+),score=82.23 TRINITY_DN1443_c0_g1_i1:39-683(+)